MPNKEIRRYFHGMKRFAPIIVLILFSCHLLQAQEDARDKDKEIKALQGNVQDLEKALQDLRARLAELERKSAAASESNAQPAKTETAPPPATSSNYMVIAGQKINLPEPTLKFGPNDRSPVKDYDTLNDIQQAAPRPDNKPIEPVLKGFIPIPGTESMIRFGGSARLDTIVDFQNNGNPNQFVPSSIPVAGQPGAGGGESSTVETKATRLSFEVRRPAGEEGSLRVYYENDFFNDSTSPDMSYRVRHFYGQAWNLLVGQTYSAFMNIDSWPDVVDNEGPNAMINRRQAQVRFSPPIYDGVGKMNLLFSIEQPNSQILIPNTGIPAGADAVTRTPDGVVGVRWEGDVGNVQVSSIFRSIGYDSGAGPRDQTVLGWGVNGSGAFNVFEKDKLTWQVAYGDGIARYVNDLGGLNLDAAPDGSGNLKALPVFATAVGYTHQWAKQFRSTASFGYVHMGPQASLGPLLGIDKTTYTSVNFMWHPTTSFRMGLEYLFGTKQTQGGEYADGNRLNFVFRYDLIR